jgi:hypothetical protein
MKPSHVASNKIQASVDLPRLLLLKCGCLLAAAWLVDVGQLILWPAPKAHLPSNKKTAVSIRMGLPLCQNGSCPKRSVRPASKQAIDRGDINEMIDART